MVVVGHDDLVLGGSLNADMPRLHATLGNGYTIDLTLGARFGVAASGSSFCIFVVPGAARLVDSPYIACVPTASGFTFRMLYPFDGTCFQAWAMRNVDTSATVEADEIHFSSGRDVRLVRVFSRASGDNLVESIFFEIDPASGQLRKDMCSFIAFGYGTSERESTTNASKHISMLTLFDDDTICNETVEK